MARRVRHKAIAVGGDKLVPRDQWAPASELHGDLKILQSPVFEIAQRAIVEQHVPKHPIAYCGLCTETRPYSSGTKWQTIKQRIGAEVDLIVLSNAGVIPLQFERQYPYLTYDGLGVPDNDPLFLQTNRPRWEAFFSRHRYELVIFHLRPNQRNRSLAEELAPELVRRGWVGEAMVLPTVEQYETGKRQQGHARMFPDLWPACWLPVARAVERASRPGVTP